MKNYLLSRLIGLDVVRSTGNLSSAHKNGIRNVLSECCYGTATIIVN